MPKVFISYRRADSQHITDRIYEHMQTHFGADNVFQDVDDIPFGVDFPDFLRAELEKCDVILVIIGADWGRIMYERCAEPNDFVRIEVETALLLRRETGKLVIPVTVGGAAMPDTALLPADIIPLCRLNAARVRPNPDFRHDCQGLADGIKRGLEQKPLTPQPPLPQGARGSNTGQDAPPQAENKRVEVVSPPKPVLPPQPVFTLPLLEWVDIPAGKVTLGGGAGTFDVKPFRIAKYPVTNQQYDAFIQDRGYTTAAYWDGLAKKFDAPKNSRWPEADCPKTNVSWVEAVAFTRWLSDKTGQPTRLPTEWEWQWAAVGDSGWDYPYGKTFDKTKCNTEESGIKRMTPVTKYAAIQTHFGTVDMAGNVWEWMLNEYSAPANVGLGGGPSRGVRGGSLFNSQDHARAAVRYYLNPYSRGYLNGFRVADVLPPSP